MPFEHADELLFGCWCRYPERHSCQDGMALDRAFNVDLTKFKTGPARGHDMLLY